MKMLMMLMMLLLPVGCGKKRSDKDIDRKEKLTLQVLQKKVDGELRVMLRLCDGRECYNTLRERDGDEFYFPRYITDRRNDRRVVSRRNVNRDHRRVHRNHHEFGGDNWRDGRQHIGSSQYVDRGYHSPQAGVTFVNGRVRFSYHFNAHASYRERISHRTRLTNRYDTGVRRSKRSDNDDYADAVGTVAERAELMRAIAEDRRWEEREHSLERLFEDGQAVRVTKRELRSLLEIVADYFDVKIDREVKDLLDLN